MKIAIIAFSCSGIETGRGVKEYIEGSGLGEATLEWKSKFCEDSIQCSHTDWTGQRFGDSDAIIFICACGIAVRSVAPFVISKTKDPAVLVIDDLGINCVSLLSGHIGGANELAVKISGAIGANPIITTGSDIRGQMAPDVLAVKNNLIIDNMDSCKTYAAELIEGNNNMSLAISPFTFEGNGSDKLWLIPKWTYVGIGCRKGIGEETIERVFNEAVEKAGIDKRSIKAFTSVNAKQNEAGLLAFCEKMGVEIEFFTSEVLNRIDGDFRESDFVRKTVGTGNVCERSCIALAKKQVGKGKEPYLALKKFGKEGVTVAIAVREEEMNYE